MILTAALLSLAASGPPYGIGPVKGWPLRTQGLIVAPPVLADVDADGLLEVIVGDNLGEFHVWTHDGRRNPPWPRRVREGDAIFGSPSVGDIDGDGDPEVVVTTLNLSLIYAWHHDGRQVRGFPITVDQPDVDFLRTPGVLANLDEDEALEPEHTPLPWREISTVTVRSKLSIRRA